MDNENPILTSLKNIEEQTARLHQVVFVFQPWIEFNNLSSNGFRIAAVPSAKIPRLQLIPLVATQSRHIESRKSSTTNKYVPVTVPYTVPIRSSYVDMLKRYGEFGLVKLDPLSCNLHEAQRRIELFSEMMEPYHQYCTLEDLTDFFGVSSPVEEQLGRKKSQVRMNAEAKIDSMVTHGKMTEAEAVLFKQCLPVLRSSAEKCHRKALHPTNGVLPQTLREINTQRKARFDEVDTFLRRQFPNYDADSRLSIRKNDNADLSELVTAIKDLVAVHVAGSKPVTKEDIETVKDMVSDIPQVSSLLESAAPQVSEEGSEGLSSDSLKRPAPPPPPPSEDTPPYEPPAGSEDTPPVPDLTLDPTRCLGTRADGEQCGRKPVTDSKYCLAHEPAKEAVATA